MVLSFFDSRSTDPKPCKYNSPAEKADSGIDLTGEDSIDEPCENEHAVNTSSSKDKGIDDENQDGHSTDGDYEGDTSSTETDDDAYDEDYFLDVGMGELMLQTSVDESHQLELPVSPTVEQNESSMWCSNLDKFSNILRSSMTNLSTMNDSTLKPYKPVITHYEDSSNNSDIIDELIEGSLDLPEENSETESQLTEDNKTMDQCESSDEEIYYSKPLSKSNIKHYYLSSNNLTRTE